MAFRFWKTLRLTPWLRLNLSKSGPSVSVGRTGSCDKTDVGDELFTELVGLCVSIEEGEV